MFCADEDERSARNSVCSFIGAYLHNISIMFRKRHRLSRAAFLHTLKNGERVSHAYFRLIYLPYHQKMISVVVSKKVARGAVSRNIIRRRILHALHESEALSAFEGKLIVIANPPIHTISFDEIKVALGEAITHMLSKQKLSR